MEAGVAVVGPRPSFRKPSHDTSQRNYRRRSPSTSSRSTSSSPSPARASSGGWKRDRSVSPLAPRKDGARLNSVQAKKGKTAHKDDDSDGDSSQGRREYGPGTSERLSRGSSYDRHGKSDLYDSRRSSGSHSDRNHPGQAIHSSRDSYGDNRRNGDYDHSARSRHSPDRGYRDRDRRIRDIERDSERGTKGKLGGRDSNHEKDTEREGRFVRDKSRDKDRDRRERDRSRSKVQGRESFFDKESETERRSGGGRGRDTTRDREREKERDRDRERDNGRIKSRHSDKDADARETDREKAREKERGRDKFQGKTGARDLGSPNDVDGDRKTLNRDREREREREKGKEKPSSRDVYMDKEPEYMRDGGRGRTRDPGREREKTRTEEKAGRDLSVVDMDRDKDVGRNRDRDRGRVRDLESYGNREDSKGQERRREPDRYSEGDPKERSFRGKEESKEGSRVKDRDEQKERIRHKDKDDPKELQKVKDEFVEARDRDLLRVKEEFSPSPDVSKTNLRQDKESSGNKIVKDEVGSPYHVSKSNSRHEKERTGGSSDLVSQPDKDSSSREKSEGTERRLSDGAREKEKGLPRSDDGEGKKEMQLTLKRTEFDGSSNFSSKDGEVKKDRGLGKGDSQRGTEVKSISVSAVDSEKSASVTLDSKVSKGSKWGPEPTDSNLQGSVSEEVANDLTAAKLAALKAAELVNKNLGVPGFMSADQKKKLLWGSKKSAAEQEPAVAAGSNRWDTVHFSDPDRQEKFHKLMSLSVLHCHWPISGREGGFQCRWQEGMRHRRRSVYRRKTTRVTARPGEAVCCWLEAKRWSDCWTRVVKNETKSGLLRKLHRCIFFVSTTYEASCEDVIGVRCELILGINLLVTFAVRSFRGISVPSEDKLSAGKVVAMISAFSWFILLNDMCTLCDLSHVYRALRCDSRGVYVIHSACFDIAFLSSLFVEGSHQPELHIILRQTLLTNNIS